MASAAVARARERNRVRAGQMRGLSRLILFTRSLPSGEHSRWSQVLMKDLSVRPPGVETNLHLNKTQRQDLLRLSFKGSENDFLACVYARVEEGVTSKDVDSIINDQLEPAFAEAFKDGALSVYQTYLRMLKKFPEGVFCGFSYPDFEKNESYQLKELSGSRGQVTHVTAEDSPHEVDGTEWGVEEPDDPPAGPDDDEEADDEEAAERVRATTEDLHKGLALTPPRCPVPAVNSTNLSRSKSLCGEDIMNNSEVMAVLSSSQQQATCMPMELDQAGAKEPEQSVSIMAVVDPQVTGFVPESEAASQVITTCMIPHTSNGMNTSVTFVSSDQQPEVVAADPMEGTSSGSATANGNGSIFILPTQKSTGFTTGADLLDQSVAATNANGDDSFSEPFDPFAKEVREPSKLSKKGKGVGKKSVAKGGNCGRKSTVNNRAPEVVTPGAQSMEVCSDDDFVESRVSTVGAPSRKRTVKSAKDKENKENKENKEDGEKPDKMAKHLCKPTGQCKCNTLTRLNLRQELSDTPRRHKKENRAYLDYRALMDKLASNERRLVHITLGLVTIEELINKTEQLAKRAVVEKESKDAMNNDLKALRAPFADTVAMDEVFGDEEKEQALHRVLATLPQRATHFPRDVVKRLCHFDLRRRVYLQRPGMHQTRGIFILGQEYSVFPERFSEFICHYMVSNIPGFKTYEEAYDRWSAFFNDSRKKAKAAMVDYFRQPRNADRDIFKMCWRDTYCGLYVIDQAAPLEQSVSVEEQELFVRRWNPVVQAAYTRKFPGGKTAEKLLVPYHRA